MQQLLPRCERKLNKSIWVVTGKQRDIAKTSGRIDLGPTRLRTQVHHHQEPSLIGRNLQHQINKQ